MNPVDIANNANQHAGFWAEYGLPGLVIFALFSTLALVCWLGIREMRTIRDDHKEERTSWLGSFEKQSDKVSEAVTGLERAIRERKV